MSAATKMKVVSGVDLSKVSEIVLCAAYESTLKKLAKDVDTPKMVEELAAHFQKQPGDTIMECEDCGGGSPSALFPDHCPYCGSRDEDDAKAKKTNGVASAATTVPDAPKSEPKKVSSKRKMKETTVEESTPGEGPATEPLVTQSEPTAMVSAPVTGIVLSEQDLNKAVARMRALRDAGASALWQLSSELRVVFDGNLWKLRDGEDGKPKYKSFEKFIAEEVDLHIRTVWRMIEVTKKFDEGQARKYGVSILRGLLSAPKEEHAAILEKVDSGEVVGKRGVEREVQKIRKRKSIKVVPGAGSKKTKGSAKGAEASAKKAAANRKITIPFPVGRKTVKLFHRAIKKTDAEKRAKRIADRPWGKFECTNGATLYFAIVENNHGELDLTVEARRDDA